MESSSENIHYIIRPDEIIILYRENDSYLYARHTGEGMIIERALVPDTQVNRTNPPPDL